MFLDTKENGYRFLYNKSLIELRQKLEIQFPAQQDEEMSEISNVPHIEFNNKSDDRKLKFSIFNLYLILKAKSLKISYTQNSVRTELEIKPEFWEGSWACKTFLNDFLLTRENRYSRYINIERIRKSSIETIYFSELCSFNVSDIKENSQVFGFIDLLETDFVKICLEFDNQIHNCIEVKNNNYNYSTNFLVRLINVTDSMILDASECENDLNVPLDSFNIVIKNDMNRAIEIERLVMHFDLLF